MKQGGLGLCLKNTHPEVLHSCWNRALEWILTSSGYSRERNTIGNKIHSDVSAVDQEKLSLFWY